MIINFSNCFGGLSNYQFGKQCKLYGIFEGFSFQVVVHCLGWVYIMTTVFWVEKFSISQLPGQGNKQLRSERMELPYTLPETNNFRTWKLMLLKTIRARPIFWFHIGFREGIFQQSRGWHLYSPWDSLKQWVDLYNHPC